MDISCNDYSVELSPYYWLKEPIVNKKKFKASVNKYNVVDLFCGAGGISCGFGYTNRFNILLGADIFIPAMKTFQTNHSNTTTILGDVRHVTDAMYQDAIGGNKVHVVTAGVPCQGFSLSNKKRHKEDERNFLFLEVMRFVELFSPDVVLIENVSGMKSMDKGSFVEEIEKALRKHGYKVDHAMLNAAEFGVPQHRKRLIFLAYKDKPGMNDVKFPEPTHGEGLKPYITIKEALGDLPMIESGEESAEYTQKPETEYQKFLFSKYNQLHNHKAPKHPHETIQKIASTKPGHPIYPKFKQRIRLAWDIQSPTQVAGGIRSQFQFGHPEKSRGLTIRERARIQSFPDDYVFEGGVVQGRVQTGNAVPPLLAKALGDKISETLDAYYSKGTK